MTVQHMTQIQEVLLGALLIAGMLYFSLSIRQWLVSKSTNGGESIRLASGFSFLTVGIGLLVLGLTSGPVPAKEIYSIPSNGSYDYYQVEGTIQNPDLGRGASSSSAWPGLESNGSKSEFSFIDAKVKDSSLILDPGFRMSLTNRIITVAGRIVWLPNIDEFDLFKSIHRQGSSDLGKKNIERLTGVYELAWLSAYESPMSENN